MRLADTTVQARVPVIGRETRDPRAIEFQRQREIERFCALNRRSKRALVLATSIIPVRLTAARLGAALLIVSRMFPASRRLVEHR